MPMSIKLLRVVQATCIFIMVAPPLVLLTLPQGSAIGFIIENYGAYFIFFFIWALCQNSIKKRRASGQAQQKS